MVRQLVENYVEPSKRMKRAFHIDRRLPFNFYVEPVLFDVALFNNDIVLGAGAPCVIDGKDVTVEA